MTRFRSGSSRAALAIVLTATLAAPVSAQLYEYKDRRIRTTDPSSPASSPMVPSKAAADTFITMEIFTGKEGVGYHAQQWEPLFERAGINARIRSASAGDKISIREKQYGKLREVFVTGKIERDGTLTFPGRSFAPAESAALADWIRELKTYGAQGNPEGKAIWGLSKGQFDELYRALSAPVEKEVGELPFDAAIRGLALPEKYPFRISAAAEKVLAMPGMRQRTPRLRLTGFSKGTALAMLLSQYGLGFQPNRTPRGSLELQCVAATDSDVVWPIGWEAPEGSYPAAIAPKLFEQTIVDLKDQKLIDVLEAIAEKTGTPVRIDFAKADARGIDLDSVLVTVPHRRATWSQLLASATGPSFLTSKIRSDERKKPFVWITTVPRRSATRSVRPGRARKGSEDLFPDLSPRSAR